MHDRAMGESERGNFMRQFRDKTNKELVNLSAPQLLMIWNHYDTDGNGYLEGPELDQFLKEFVSSVTDYEQGDEMVVSPTALSELKEEFLDAYDDNEDGRIEIRELANLLPVDENFLLLFQLENKIESSVDFMEVWRRYDADNNGCIEASELGDFLLDLLKSVRTDAEIDRGLIKEYAETLVELFDENKDGKLQLEEMSRLLPVKANALEQTLKGKMLKGSVSLEPYEIERVFTAYDKDGSGSIEGKELLGLVRDMMLLMKPHASATEVNAFHALLLKSCDIDGDGRISRDELTMLLLGLQHYCTLAKHR